MKFFFISICSCIFLCACGGQQASKPKHILSHQSMEKILLDLAKADALWEVQRYKDTSFTEDSLFVIYQQILALHKTDKKNFFKSFDWYLAHPDYNSILMDSLNNKAQRLRQNQFSRPGAYQP
jgi:hypothetical protein